jgi:hypothetical protein
MSKKIKIDNVTFKNKIIPFNHLKVLYWGLNRINEMPFTGPTDSVRDLYPDVKPQSKKIYVQKIDMNISYIVEERGITSKVKGLVPINCRGYLIDLRFKKKLESFSDLETMARMMDVDVGKGLINQYP